MMSGTRGGSNDWRKDVAQRSRQLRRRSPSPLPSSSPPLIATFSPDPGPEIPQYYHTSSSQLNRQILKAIALVGLIVLIIVAALIGIFWLRAFHSPKHHEPFPLHHSSSVAAAEEQLSPTINRVVVQFVSKSTIQLFEKYALLPNISFTQLVSYDVCCVPSNSQRLICSSGSAFGHNGEYLEAFVESELSSEAEEVVFLFLWLNSQNLIEVGCWLEYTTLVS
jgi:hypothetical protein